MEYRWSKATCSVSASRQDCTRHSRSRQHQSASRMEVPASSRLDFRLPRQIVQRIYQNRSRCCSISLRIFVKHCFTSTVWYSRMCSSTAMPSFCAATA